MSCARAEAGKQAELVKQILPRPRTLDIDPEHLFPTHGKPFSINRHNVTTTLIDPIRPPFVARMIKRNPESVKYAKN